MLQLLTLWCASVLVDDAGHHGLAQFAQVILIICTFFWVIGLLVTLAAADD